MAECIWKDKKTLRYSPGCGGEVSYSSGLSELNPKTMKTKRVPGRTCRLHYLENAFGLYALECPECKKQDKDTFRDQIQKETDVAMEDVEKYTFVPCEIIFASARYTWFLKKHVPAFDIKCWHCGFRFFQSQKATEVERVRNELEGLKQIPEMSEQMKKALQKGKKL